MERDADDRAAETSALPPVAIIGGGSIGGGFALVLANHGVRVCVCDVDASERSTVRERITDSLVDLREYGLLDRGIDETLSMIAVTGDLAEAVQQAAIVLECVPEDLAQKRRLFAELDELTSSEVVLASASSALTATDIAGNLAGRSRCLVAHPGNPPFLIKAVEIVPAPFTTETAVSRLRGFLGTIGLSPIVLRKEIRGFVFNRLQGAVLREAYCLVRDGVASVEEIDRLVRDGLGLRWSVVGPFETADLNRPGGIEVHARTMGEAYAQMGAERGQRDPWTPDLVRKVTEQRRALLPLTDWRERIRWRDRQLMAVLAARRRVVDDS